MGNTLDEDGRHPIRRIVLPWRQTNPGRGTNTIHERWKAGRVTFAELCGQFGISRKTGYKRVQRYEAYGWEGLGTVAEFGIVIPTGPRAPWPSG